MKKNFFIQLPFPSTLSPKQALDEYYKDYFIIFKNYFPKYNISYSLWEIPLWVAHLSERLKFYEQFLIDLSGEEYNYIQVYNKMIEYINRAACYSNHDIYLFFSPLTQNVKLCNYIARRVKTEYPRVKTIMGGNMSYWGEESLYNCICHGILKNQLKSIFPKLTPLENCENSLSYSPNYQLLTYLNGKVPLLRLNASHGCLNQCKFCGDVWSQQLLGVPLIFLEKELEDFMTYFPSIDTIYIGDKTFGQSWTALRNLENLFQNNNRYNLIVQTTFSMIKTALITSMNKINVKVVELGFETANYNLLMDIKKPILNLSQMDHLIKMLNNNGIKVILNVMGGLPEETEETMLQTLKTLEQLEGVWLYNLYNFVPYPYTPYSTVLKENIEILNYDYWREDSDIVFKPFYINRVRSNNHFEQLINICHEKIRENNNVKIS